MPRDLDPLTARTFDLLVVGGGVYGMTIACDAAQRGLHVALIERNDFGSGSSFNHLRTIHGGLRYLQTLDIPRARESVRERRTLAFIAPWAVAPLPFVLPLSNSLTRGPWAMRAGFLLDRLVTSARNRDLPAPLRLPAGRVLSRAQAIDEFSALEGTTSIGAAVWYDYVATEADRLTLSWGLAAARLGAVLRNYVEAISLTLDGKRVVGVQARDRESGRTLDVAASLVVNATAGSIDTLLHPVNQSLDMPTLRAINIVTAKAAPGYAVGGRGRSGRNLFMVPWRGRALFGTWESEHAVPASETRVPAAAIDTAIADINQAFPSISISRDEVALVHRGIVPALQQSDGSVVLDGGEKVYDHATGNGLESLISVAGTKYTTARGVAERTIDLVLRKLRKQGPPCRTATTPLAPPPAEGDALLAHAAREEQVVHLADAVIRRTPLGALGPPDRPALERAAQIVGDTLGWSDQTRAQEIERTLAFYRT